MLRCQFCCAHLDSKGSLNQLIYGCLSQAEGQRDRFASLLKVWWGNKCTTVIASPHDKQTCQFKHFQGFTYSRSAYIELASQLKLVWQFLAGYKGAIINLSSYARLNQFKVAFRCFYGLKDWFVFFLFRHAFVFPFVLLIGRLKFLSGLLKNLLCVWSSAATRRFNTCFCVFCVR